MYLRQGKGREKRKKQVKPPYWQGIKSKTMKTKTAKEIISQSKRIFATLDKSAPNYSARLHSIAEIGRAYLRNIARHHGKPYGLKTWRQIGGNPVPASIYAKQPEV